MKCLLLVLLSVVFAGSSQAQVLARYGGGEGPGASEGLLRLLDAAGSPSQSNAIGFACEAEGGRDRITLTAELRVEEGGEGGALVFLDTAKYGLEGPAPFVPSWVEPNLAGSFAVGIDVHDPKDEDPFRGPGNYQGLPEREVSLHWSGRELVKRVAEGEFRGDWVPLELELEAVCGGTEVSLRIGDSLVFERFFVAGMLPYESRLAVGADTRVDGLGGFDLRALECSWGQPAAPPRPPAHVEVFNHVLTGSAQTAYQTEVILPPVQWSFGRVILTLELHDAGKMWDEWDRTGFVSVWDDAGNKHTLVPFITSYRTECFWQVDVTEFRPWLAGPTRMAVAAGTSFYKGRGFMMSVGLDFYHGAFAGGLEPFELLPLWEGVAHYGSDENHYADFFQPRELELPSEAVAGVVRTCVTGHSQVGEFTPSERRLVFHPDAAADLVVSYADRLWKTDCYLNPNRPQGGTWKYSRAGWAPGDVVHPWRVDLAGAFQPGRRARFEYEAEPYDFGEAAEDERPEPGAIAQANQVVSSYLVLYRPAGELVSAPVLRVNGVTGGSSAAEAGILIGDWLSSYDGLVVDSVEGLTAAKAAATEAGKALVPVVVFRGAERLELEIKTGQMGVELGS